MSPCGCPDLRPRRRGADRRHAAAAAFFDLEYLGPTAGNPSSWRCVTSGRVFRPSRVARGAAIADRRIVVASSFASRPRRQRRSGTVAYR